MYLSRAKCMYPGHIFSFNFFSLHVDHQPQSCSVAELNARPNGNQEVTGSIPSDFSSILS